MAEQEVIKHTKAIYKAWNNPSTSWKHKLKDIFLEVAIIVFAISLSLWFHNWSEKNHDRQEEFEFLDGLKTDLANDTLQLESDRSAYERVLEGARYFYRVSFGEPLNKDSLEKHEFLFQNFTRFNANINRYEALKSSGRLDIIEDKNLLNDIMNYYQQEIIYINMFNDEFNNYKAGRLGSYLDEHLVYNSDGSSNWETILRSTPVKNGLKRIMGATEVADQYDVTLKKAKKLLKEIKEVH